MVHRLDLKPPIDVFKIAKSLATVTEKSFPIEIDGLCLDLKVVGKRPKIWISKDLGERRRRFTLAHEIGHIVIPWHTGTIVDEIEAPQSTAPGTYREMEAEANRFAAEILMPNAWVRSLIDRMDHLAGVMHTIVQVANVSFPAALFRTLKFGPPGYVAGEVRDGIIVSSGKTKGTRSSPPEVGMNIGLIDMPVAFEPQVIANEGSRYFWWEMREEVEAPTKPISEWRDILEKILQTIPVELRAQMRSRVNAIIGYAIGKVPKGSRVEQIYHRGLEASQNRSDGDQLLRIVMAHPDFKDYILARAYERAREKTD